MLFLLLGSSHSSDRVVCASSQPHYVHQRHAVALTVNVSVLERERQVQIRPGRIICQYLSSCISSSSVQCLSWEQTVLLIASVPLLLLLQSLCFYLFAVASALFLLPLYFCSFAFFAVLPFCFCLFADSSSLLSLCCCHFAAASLLLLLPLFFCPFTSVPLLRCLFPSSPFCCWFCPFAVSLCCCLFALFAASLLLSFCCRASSLLSSLCCCLFVYAFHFAFAPLGLFLLKLIVVSLLSAKLLLLMWAMCFCCSLFAKEIVVSMHFIGAFELYLSFFA